MALIRRLDAAVLAFAIARTHDGHAHSGHDGLHVGEVEIDHAGNENEIGDAADRLVQDIVGKQERIRQTRRLLDVSQQPLVGNGNHRVDGCAQLVQSPFGLRRLSVSLRT